MIATINPVTGETLRTFSPLSPGELEGKLDLAAAAFRNGVASTVAERGARLLQLADLFEAEQERLARLMALEMGKPIQAGLAEILKCVDGCRYYAAHAAAFLAEAPLPDAVGKGRAHVRVDPLGPVLAIMPWNFPFWQAIRFAAPALMAGNVGLLKHANNVPQCALALEELFLNAGFPEGVFQNLLIETETVGQVIDDPRVAAVTLTGSLAAGSEVAARAGKAIKRTVLELGGSDPFVVLPSADLVAAAQKAVKSRTTNSGQSCIAAKRFIVHAAVYDEFEYRMVEGFKRLRVGDPLLPETEVGPLAHGRAFATLERQVRDAVGAGGTVLIGGRQKGMIGFFYEPTVIAGLSSGAPVAQEEFFGPVALLFKARDLDEAIALANRTPFGLGASVWTRDALEQRRCIAEIEAGQVFVNEVVASQPALPFGGIKRSGYGRELGAFGIHEFVNVKTVWVAE